MNNYIDMPLFEAISRWQSSQDGAAESAENLSPQQYVTDMQEMCSLLQPVKREEQRTPIYTMLHRWYMPCNEHHTRQYMGRYAVFNRLESKIKECVEERRNKQ